MATLLGFTGHYGSGKDSAAKFAVDDHGFTRVAFADSLKRVAESIDPHVDDGYLLSEILEWHGWDWDAAKKRPSIRRLLQNLGVAVRQEDEDFWVKAAHIEDALEAGLDVVVTDVRFPNELDHIENLGGTVVRVVRPGFDGDSHISERALDGYVIPEVANDGTLDDLRHRVGALVHSLQGLVS